MRDLNRVLAFIIREVVPAEEKAVLAKLKILYQTSMYVAPELQGSHWSNAAARLNDILGDPVGCPWKERIANIFTDKVKVPDDFRELPPIA